MLQKIYNHEFTEYQNLVNKDVTDTLQENLKYKRFLKMEQS